MTYAELKTQILDLGFETSSTYNENPTIMVNAINRAMREITNYFPIIDSYKIAQSPLTNLLGGECANMLIRHYDGVTPITLTASGAKSFYFEYAGNGRVTIQDDNGTNAINLTSESGSGYTPYKGIADGNVTLTFDGDYSFNIRNTAIYGEKYSNDTSDIPDYRRNIRYNFKELTKQDDEVVFIDFLDKVQQGDGDTYINLRAFQVEKRHIIVLDGMSKVEYTIFYRKNFTAFTTTTLDSREIELDKDKEHLLPLLAAWYVWADDDPTKAAQCKNDYEDCLTTLLSVSNPDTAEESFVNARRW